MLKTIRTIEDKKYPLQGVTGFNQVVIKLQLILDIAFCDYEEEKKEQDAKILALRRMRCVTLALDQTGSFALLEINLEIHSDIENVITTPQGREIKSSRLTFTAERIINVETVSVPKLKVKT